MSSIFTDDVRTAANPYKVLIAGGCYSGLSAAINLLERCDTIDSPIPVEITIVDERDGFFHVIGSPLALATRSYAEKAWVEYKDVKVLQRPDVRFVHGSLNKIDCETKMATISEGQTTRTETYDFFIAATGLRRAWPVVPQALSRKSYLMESGTHIDSVTNSTAPILVVGGGAVGIEMAAELKEVKPNVNVTLAHSRDKLLSAEPLPDMVKDCALELTQQTGVEVLLNHRLTSATPAKNENGIGVFEVEFSNGHKMVASQVIMAISKSTPSTDFLPKAALSTDGYVNIQPTMQLAPETPNAASHFAVGDLIHWSGIKRCGAAMHEGKFAGLNIHQIMLQHIQGREPVFNRLGEIPPMIGLAVGKNAVSYGPEGMNHGPQVMQRFFEDDLGFRIVWDHLRLGGMNA
ncbi:Uu.00g078490.m01.CDS01 [Anthostomella pinea]|uniref:Uu.00g078490.m01.CDS01 n=1 Tax=Anthostomella pinea TaxID=933095 RepID=A0AAI8YJ96_9PEZI|nr:Uu.00g078490.m01.CDS01 [Anthostomella pinea]